MTSIGRYQIRKELGRGAMGIVYLADDPVIGRQVAIKTVRLDLLSRPGDELLLRRRIFREAQSAGKLSHPNIVTIYDFAEVDGITRIVMEYVAGETLYRVMQRHPCSPARALHMLRPIAQALDYAHSRGVLHCDVKPENLIVSREGIPKVMDFGIARIISETTMLNGMVLGTPSYMSPEQVLGQPLTGATDQYSLAVVAFELLAGAKPFEASSVPDLLHRIAYAEPAIQKLAPKTPPRMTDVLRKALAKDPAGRYPACMEMIAALRAASNEQPQAEALPVATSPEHPPGPCASPWWLWPAAGACTSTLLAGLMVFSVSRPQRPQLVSSPPAIESPVPVITRPLPAPQPTDSGWSVEVISSPAGAVVSWGGSYCVAPCRIRFPRGDHYVTAKLAGHQTQHRLVQIPKQSSLRIDLPACSAHQTWESAAGGCGDETPGQKPIVDDSDV